MERVAAEEPPAGDRQVEQRPIELILARQLAAALAVPVLLMDGRGDTLFFNEPAELIIARRFDEIDELSFEQRAATLAPRDEVHALGRGGGVGKPRELLVAALRVEDVDLRRAR